MITRRGSNNMLIRGVNKRPLVLSCYRERSGSISCSSGQSEFSDQRKPIIQRSTVEQLPAIDACCARATEVEC